jgi:biopolymer transport protein ExbB
MQRFLRTLLLIVCISAATAVAHQSVFAQTDATDASTVEPTVEDTQTDSFAAAFFMAYSIDSTGKRSIEVFGTAIIWTLLLMSMTNLGLIGYLSLTNLRKSFVPAGVLTEVRRLMGAGDFPQILELTRTDKSYFSQVLHAGLKEANHGLGAMVRAVEQSSDLLATARMRPIEILYMFGQISPMIGLLGTVYGIIFAFRVFVAMGGHASPALLAGGIGTALVATFWGLMVAIPALAGFSILRNKVDELSLEATLAAEEIFSKFRPKAGPVPKPAPMPSAAS